MPSQSLYGDMFDNGYQVLINSTSLSDYLRCPKYYEYVHIQGWRSDEGKSRHLLFGGWFAEAMQTFYLSRLYGHTREESIRECVRNAMMDTWEHELDENGDRIPGTGQAWDSLDTKKNRANLIRSIIWYFEHYENDFPVYTMPSGTPAVELQFRIEANPNVFLVGTIDRVVEYFPGDTYLMDQKAQPLTTNVLTPSGWRAIGDLSVGDSIYGRDGLTHSVTKIFPKGVTSVYRVTFRDGSSVEAAGDHLWTVATTQGKWTTKTTEQLTSKHRVPNHECIQHEEKSLPLDPYLLGYLLGDGYLAGHSIQVAAQNAPQLYPYLPGADKIKKANSDNTAWTISGGSTLSAIRELDLYGCKSRTKFIPKEYFFGSEKQRRELLRGLLDTDGSWNGRSRIYDTMSLQLARDVCNLVRSLGGQARYRDRGDECYRLSIRMPEFPTGLGRRYIYSVIRIADAPTACIAIDAPDHLYITEDYIPTHNTTGSAINTRWAEQWDINTQFSFYTFGGRMILPTPARGFIVDGISLAVGSTDFGRALTYRSDAYLDEWFATTLDTISDMHRDTERKRFRMNPGACSSYEGCAFRKICARAPSQRENFLRADFHREEKSK